MQSHIQKKDSLSLKSGTLIQGKWNRHKYIVIRKLGSGTVGTVYLCRTNKQLVALKISEQALSLTTEANVLKALNKVQDTRLGPFLLDVDDWESHPGRRYAFYVMEYIHGQSLESFVKEHGSEWIGVFMVQILEQLETLHQAGWVFGDLKNDNLLITTSPTTVRFIDVGGTTKRGRSIKEYSEFYDRAYWLLGTREAEPSYDLFALVMVLLSIYYPQHFQRVNNSKQLILNKIANVPALHIYEQSLEKAIKGQYKRAEEMKKDLLQTIWKRQSKKQQQINRSSYFAQAAIISCISTVYYFLFHFLF